MGIKCVKKWIYNSLRQQNLAIDQFSPQISARNISLLYIFNI